MKEIDKQVQEAQRVPNKMDEKRLTPRHIIIKMPKLKDKEKILKRARKKQLPEGSSYKIVNWFLKQNFAGQKGMARNIQSDEKQRPATRTTLPKKAVI